MTDDNRFVDSPDQLLTDHETGDPPRRLRRWMNIVLISMAVLLVGGVLSTGSYLWSLNSKFDNINRDASVMVADTADRPAPGAKNALNILLIGSGYSNETILIAHITAKRDKVYLVAFPRDSYIDVPGHGKKRLNAVYGLGGRSLLVQTLEQLTNVRIDHVAQLGADGYSAVASTLGANDVNVATSFSVEGVPELDRLKNQEDFLKEVVGDVLSAGTLSNPVRVSRAVDAVTKHLTVDAAFDTGEMRSLGWSLRGVRDDDVVLVTGPVASVGRISTGASISRLDTAKLSELSKALRQDTMSSYQPR